MRRLRIVLWVLVAFAAAGMAGLLFAPKPEPQTALPGEPLGKPFALTDHNGNAVTEAAFQGRPTVVFFGFTHCPEICPTTLYELNGWLETVDPAGERIAAYFVTVDPERDTAVVLKDYVTAISDRITGITGDPVAVAAMLKDYHVFFRKVPLDDGDYTMDHNASVFLLDAERRFVGTIGYGELAETAIAKLQRLADGGLDR